MDDKYKYHMVLPADGFKPGTTIIIEIVESFHPSVIKRDEVIYESLTSREMDVVQLIASGVTDREISNKIFVSERTVHGYVHKIFGKLGINSRTELTRIAFSKGWVSSGIISSDSVVLSDKELMVLKLLCDGLQNKQIAIELDFSLQQVNHLIHVMLKKTQLPNRATLAITAEQKGWLRNV